MTDDTPKPCQHQRADYRTCPHCMGIGSASPKPAREWWINKSIGTGGDVLTAEAKEARDISYREEGFGQSPDRYIHVIEYSAYQALKQRLDAHMGLHKGPWCDPDEYTKLESELTAVREEIERLKQLVGIKETWSCADLYSGQAMPDVLMSYAARLIEIKNKDTRIRQLGAALLKYGSHSEACAGVSLYFEDEEEEECTCGFRQAFERQALGREGK